MKYYVYIHYRQDGVTPYYVGKGRGRRANDKGLGRRNIVWVRMSSKYGLIVDICQDNMIEDDAHLLEMWLIEKFRHEGFILANLTDGGEGTSGHIKKSRKAIISLDEQGNRIRHQFAGDAIDYLLSIGIRNPSQANISTAAIGKRRTAYNHVWWYEGCSEKDFTSRSDLISTGNSRRVMSSIGEEFSSLQKAAEYLRKNGYPLATAGAISHRVDRSNTIYGRRWSYINFPEHTDHVGLKAIGRSTAERLSKAVISDKDEHFESCAEAARWLRKNGHPRAVHSNIAMCANGQRNIAYGRVWKFNPQVGL